MKRLQNVLGGSRAIGTRQACTLSISGSNNASIPAANKQLTKILIHQFLV